ncbi:hypothetical protein BDW02DRAFT_595588 [Decorospora gaudefroyi]|uniref:RNase H type-1 domain-containing protein n=1 Tax=Decorospora gaudefroyi TaxID=184978 RepID=A0A6A5KMT1_9PLEO|nr:hypothetical protein BDW02DRAFT_595588 [Decorospora gaudefroyi]
MAKKELNVDQGEGDEAGLNSIQKARNRALRTLNVTEFVTREWLKEMQTASKQRRARIVQQTIGQNTAFAGTVYVDPCAAWQDDKTRIQDVLARYHHKRAAVFWTDGSASKYGMLGAAVVWRATLENTWKDGDWLEASYAIGYQTRGAAAADAELFAIAAALDIAQGWVQNDRTRFELVRVYSDASTQLHQIRKDAPRDFGPMLGPELAVKALYERAQWLADQGVKVELHWVKGHKNSLGNKRADTVARMATEQQTLVTLADDAFDSGVAMTGKMVTEKGVPAWVKEQGPDWVDEWLWRANRGFYGVQRKLNRGGAEETWVGDELLAQLELEAVRLQRAMEL